MKKSLVLAMAMSLGITASAYAANPFSDVPAGNCTYDSVNKLAAAGIFDGLHVTSVCPNPEYVSILVGDKAHIIISRFHRLSKIHIGSVHPPAAVCIITSDADRMVGRQGYHIIFLGNRLFRHMDPDGT